MAPHGASQPPTTFTSAIGAMHFPRYGLDKPRPLPVKPQKAGQSNHASRKFLQSPARQRSLSAFGTPTNSVSTATMQLGQGFRCFRWRSHLQALTRVCKGWLSRTHAATPQRHRPPVTDPRLRRGVAARTRTYYRTHRCGTSWRVAETARFRSKTPHRPRCGVFRFQLLFHLKPCIRTTLPPPNRTAAAPQALQWHAWSALPTRPPRPDATAVFLTARFLSSQGTQAS